MINPQDNKYNRVTQEARDGKYITARDKAKTFRPKDDTPDELDKILLDVFSALSSAEAHDWSCIRVVDGGCECDLKDKYLPPTKQKLRDSIAREIAEVIGEDNYTSNSDRKLQDYIGNRNELRAEQHERAADRGWRIGE